MILPDHEIRRRVGQGSIGIEPFNPFQVQPASYDMCLGDLYRTYRGQGEETDLLFDTIDPKSPDRRTHLDRIDPEGLVLGKHSFILASTAEKVRIPAELVGRVEGKSSLARMGLFVHVTAGFVDPGFEGHITLELFNGNHFGIKLYPGMPICQMSFERMASAAEHPYGHDGNGSKYIGQGSEGPVESMYYKNFL